MNHLKTFGTGLLVTIGFIITAAMLLLPMHLAYTNNNDWYYALYTIVLLPWIYLMGVMWNQK